MYITDKIHCHNYRVKQTSDTVATSIAMTTTEQPIASWHVMSHQTTSGPPLLLPLLLPSSGRRPLIPAPTPIPTSNPESEPVPADSSIRHFPVMNSVMIPVTLGPSLDVLTSCRSAGFHGGGHGNLEKKCWTLEAMTS